MPQAPFRALQSANRFGRQLCVGRAKTASGLQRVFEAYRDMPPIQDDCGVRQRLALQPPQPGIAVAQHCRRRVRRYAHHRERLFERAGCNRRAVARESEAGLAALGVDDLAGDHLKVALVLAVPAADVAAIKSNHDGFAEPRRRWLRRYRDMRLHNGLTGPPGSVA